MFIIGHRGETDQFPGEYPRHHGPLQPKNFGLVDLSTVEHAHRGPDSRGCQVQLRQSDIEITGEAIFLFIMKDRTMKDIFRFQDGLDMCERYVESPRHVVFFTSMVRSVIADTRQHVILNDLELQTVLQDFSTIQ